MSDEMTVLGVDGIRRSFGEHYDTIREVEQDPTGAMWAIHKQADRIGELEAKLAKAMNIAEVLSGCVEYDYHGNVCGEEEAKAIAALAELEGDDDDE